MMKTITLILITVIFSNHLNIIDFDYQNSDLNVTKSSLNNKNVLKEQVVQRTALTFKMKEIEFTFHPNPANNIINFKSNERITQILIFDVLGKQVKNAYVDFNNSKIDVSELASGAYIMKVSVGSNSKNYKFIKL